MPVTSVAVVSLELHKTFSRAVTMGAEATVLDDVRVSHAKKEEMEVFFRQFDRGTDVVMEATFNWPWIADIAMKCGMNAHLGDPMRLKHYRKGLPKSDRKDAIGAGTLWVRKMFPEAYHAAQTRPPSCAASSNRLDGELPVGFSTTASSSQVAP